MKLQTKSNFIAFLLAAVLLCPSCAPFQSPQEAPLFTISPALPTATPIVPEIEEISIQVDPSYQDFFASDPYSQLTENKKQVWDSADRALYNALYSAVQAHADTFDVSEYDLTIEQIIASCESLYEPSGLQLYYLTRVKYDRKKKLVKFEYTEDTPEQIQATQEAFYKQMNHLLYNVVPEGYSPAQRFFSVYDYIAQYADYTDDITDLNTISVNSILVRRTGICGSFSMLLSYALNFLQVPTEYVSNLAHAWNIVTLDGVRYQTDLTWGAGWSSGPKCNIRYILMDDARRMETLDQNGYAQFEIISGYPRKDAVAPLPCTDTRYSPLATAYGPYALDVENGWLYYTDDAGIQRMTLDGTQIENVSPQRANSIVYHDGNLYFADEIWGKLYRMLPGQNPELLDDSIPVYQLYILDGILHYGDGMGIEKTLDLNAFQSGSIPGDLHQEPAAAVPNTHTYAIKVRFSQPMDTSSLPRAKIGLLTDSGRSLPLHLTWSDDGRTLTIRSRSNLVLEHDVTLYIAPGLRSSDGQPTPSGRIQRIEIEE